MKYVFVAILICVFGLLAPTWITPYDPTHGFVAMGVILAGSAWMILAQLLDVVRRS